MGRRRKLGGEQLPRKGERIGAMMREGGSREVAVWFVFGAREVRASMVVLVNTPGAMATCQYEGGRGST